MNIVMPVNSTQAKWIKFLERQKLSAYSETSRNLTSLIFVKEIELQFKAFPEREFQAQMVIL